MTAFEDLERGDIVWASDPLSEKGRLMLILGAPHDVVAPTELQISLGDGLGDAESARLDIQ